MRPIRTIVTNHAPDTFSIGLKFYDSDFGMLFQKDYPLPDIPQQRLPVTDGNRKGSPVAEGFSLSAAEYPSAQFIIGTASSLCLFTKNAFFHQILNIPQCRVLRGLGDLRPFRTGQFTLEAVQ